MLTQGCSTRAPETSSISTSQLSAVQPSSTTTSATVVVGTPPPTVATTLVTSTTTRSGLHVIRLRVPDGIYGGTWTLTSSGQAGPPPTQVRAYADGTTPRHDIGDMIGIRVTDGEPEILAEISTSVPSGGYKLCVNYTRTPYCTDVII